MREKSPQAQISGGKRGAYVNALKTTRSTESDVSSSIQGGSPCPQGDARSNRRRRRYQAVNRRAYANALRTTRSTEYVLKSRRSDRSAGFYRRSPVPLVGGCSGDTGGGTKFAGFSGATTYGCTNAFCPGQGVTAMMQSRSIGAAASAAFIMSLSAEGSAAIAA
jgi:hypothetical protein